MSFGFGNSVGRVVLGFTVGEGYVGERERGRYRTEMVTGVRDRFLGRGWVSSSRLVSRREKQTRKRRGQRKREEGEGVF